MRRRVEETRISGRKPVSPQSFGNGPAVNEPLKSIALADESEVFEAEKEERAEKVKSPWRKEPIVLRRPGKNRCEENFRTQDRKRQSELQAAFSFAAARRRAKPKT